MIETGVALSTAFYTSVGGMSFGFSFLVVRWFATFVAGRIDRKEANVDAGTQRLIERLEKQVDALLTRVTHIDEDLAECKRRHAESEAEVMSLKAQMQGYGKAREDAALIVASERLKDKHRPGEGE